MPLAAERAAFKPRSTSSGSPSSLGRVRVAAAGSACARRRSRIPDGPQPSMKPGLSRGELPAGFNLLSGLTHVGQRPVCVSHSTIRRRHILRDRLSSVAEAPPSRSMPKVVNTCRRTQPWQTQRLVPRGSGPFRCSPVGERSSSASCEQRPLVKRLPASPLPAAVGKHGHLVTSPTPSLVTSASPQR
jgi:hypothetical protein